MTIKDVFELNNKKSLADTAKLFLYSRELITYLLFLEDVELKLS